MHKKILVVVFLSLSFFGCKFPHLSENMVLNDISETVNYSHLRTLAYMGGSLYFNPVKPSESPIIVDAKIACRLGMVSIEQVDNERAIYTDIENAATYGLLSVESVNDQKIELSCLLYSKGKVIKNNFLSLSLSESVDLNDDGFDDISFAEPQIKRPGLETVIYLNFLSSKEDQKTTMFAIIPEQYPNGDYPNGVLGINNEGRLLVERYKADGTARIISSGLQFGDYVLNSKSGSYERYIGSSVTKVNRALSDHDLEPIDQTFPITYLFNQQEISIQQAKELLSLFPKVIISLIHPDILAQNEVEQLNYLLKQKDLIELFETVRKGPIPESELSGVINGIGELHDEEIIQLNRLYLEHSFPQHCPVSLVVDNPLAEVFQLLSCIVENPNSDTIDEPVLNEDERALGVGTARTSSEYNIQAEAINQKWSKYKPILEVKNGEMIKILQDFFTKSNSSVTGTASDTNSSPSSSNIPILQKTTQYFVTTVQNIWESIYTPPDQVKKSGLIQAVTANSSGQLIDENGNVKFIINRDFAVPDSVSDFLTAKVGVYGFLKNSWGNIEGGATVATYLNIDNSFIFSTNVNNDSSSTVSKTVSSENNKMKVELKLFDSLPIQIGVVSVTVALNGGVAFPLKINASTGLSLPVRIAFTGMYGAEASVGARYGVQMVSKKVLWWRVSVPSVELSPYSSGKLINETAYFIGPSDWLIIKSTPALESASVSLSITPTVFLEPRVAFNQVLWVGINGSIGNEYQFTVSAKPVKERWYPEIHGIGTTSIQALVSAKAGFSVVVPVVNYRWEPTYSIPIYSSPKKEWARWNAF